MIMILRYEEYSHSSLMLFHCGTAFSFTPIFAPGVIHMPELYELLEDNDISGLCTDTTGVGCMISVNHSVIRVSIFHDYNSINAYRYNDKGVSVLLSHASPTSELYCLRERQYNIIVEDIKEYLKRDPRE